MDDAEAPIRLVLLYGGQSAEHDVSRISAASLLRALAPGRYDVLPVGIGADGTWHRADDVVAALAAGPDTLPSSLPLGDVTVTPQQVLSTPDPQRRVVVLPLLHGPRGEDGTVQGLLELADVAYVGCGVLGSALNMDKAMAKALTAAAGLPQVRHLVTRDVAADDAFFGRVADELGFPVFVKPANMGSSVGVGRADDDASLRVAVALAATFDEWVVVEEGVDARELEVGVIGNDEPRTSVVGEIVPTHDFYDYEDKYLDGNATMVIPADLPAGVAVEARRLAVEAFEALRCEGLARVDFFWEQEGRGLLLNEINTMPGFTPYSMFPSLWAASGLDYRALVDELVDLAIRRHRHRAPHRRTR